MWALSKPSPRTRWSLMAQSRTSRPHNSIRPGATATFAKCTKFSIFSYRLAWSGQQNDCIEHAKSLAQEGAQETRASIETLRCCGSGRHIDETGGRSRRGRVGRRACRRSGGFGFVVVIGAMMMSAVVMCAPRGLQLLL
jgi:hypothetical protein